MDRGDAERAVNDISEARPSYEEARKLDRGLYSKALDERMAALPAQ